MITLDGNPIVIVLAMAILGSCSLASAFLAVGRYIHLHRYTSTLFLSLALLAIGVIALAFAFAVGRAAAIDMRLLAYTAVISFFVTVFALAGFTVASFVEIARALLIRAGLRKKDKP